MRVSTLLQCLLSLVCIARIAAGAPMEFPYQAVVKNDGVVVRSGPGERYDPTLKLNTGHEVTVHRHDPGGWFMITPPSGSFSWIDATYVQKTSPESGLVKVDDPGNGVPARVVVWIGSQFTDEHKYFGRQLASGDEVHILGESTVQTDRGPVRFYKISPPRLEYRWVKGDFIVPRDEAGNIAKSSPSQGVETPPVSNSFTPSDPFTTLPSANSTMAAPGFPQEEGPSLLERELTRGTSAGKGNEQRAASSSSDPYRTQLSALDEQLKSMLARTPKDWDLPGMEQAYRQLQSTAGPSVAAQIDSRLAAIDARKKIKAEYDAFINVVTETEQRDAALLSMQQSIASGVPVSALQVDLGQPTGFPSQAMDHGLTQNPGGNVPTGPQSIAPPSVSQSGDPQAAIPQMDGAGIVQRLPRPSPGLPQHALVAPDGRLLAYLTAGQGIRLDNYIGKSMGVIGQRSHDPRLRSDVIVVERLTPVQLQR